MKYTFTLLAFALSVAIPASAATNYYLSTPFTGTVKTPGCSSGTIQIQGSSAIETPDGINSFTFGGTDPVSATGGGKLTLQNFVISKGFDNCSAPLITAFLTSEVMPTVSIYAKRSDGVAGQVPTPYLTITLKNVIISQYTLTGAPDGSNLGEQISLAFASASVTALKADGSGTTTLNYDGSLNQITR